MQHLRRFKALVACCSIALFAIACTITTTKTKNPTFSVTTDSLQLELNKIVSCESIAINGTEITRNKKTSYELEIGILNGNDIPSDQNEMIELGKQIAKTIKNGLQNKNEFDIYKVLFISRSENGGFTRQESRSKEFKSAEL